MPDQRRRHIKTPTRADVPRGWCSRTRRGTHASLPPPDRGPIAIVGVVPNGADNPTLVVDVHGTPLSSATERRQFFDRAANGPRDWRAGLEVLARMPHNVTGV